MNTVTAIWFWNIKLFVKHQDGRIYTIFCDSDCKNKLLWWDTETENVGNEINMINAVPNKDTETCHCSGHFTNMD